MFKASAPGVDFTNISLEAYISADPKAQKYNQAVSLFWAFGIHICEH